MLRLIVNFLIAVLVLFNTYKSFKSRRGEKALRIQYSHYFKIMSIYLVLDNLFSTILRFIPFYQISRLLMVVWLSVPTCSGAAFVYRFYVNGFLKVYEQDLDQYIKNIREKITNHFLFFYNYANTKYREGRKRKEIQDASSLLIKSQNSMIEEEPQHEVGLLSKSSLLKEREVDEQPSSNDEVSNVSEVVMESE